MVFGNPLTYWLELPERRPRGVENVVSRSRPLRHLPLRNVSPHPAAAGFFRCFRGLCGWSCYPTISVEHVCPQTLEAGSQWAEWFSTPEEHSTWLHSLGNLVLLNFKKNSSARNYEFEKKKTKYFAPGDTSAFTLTNEVRGFKTWKPSDIEERREVLLQRLASDWHLDNEFQKWWEIE